jgi:hypothetical protein
MHRFPWETASPVKDRLLTIEDDSDDSDAGAGDDFSDDSDVDLESELDTRDDDADLEGEEATYKKRFTDTKNDRDRLKREKDEQAAELASLRQEIETLKSVQGQRGTKGADYGEERTGHLPDEIVLADQISDAINREYLALPKEQQHVRNLTKITLKHQAPALRKIMIEEAQRLLRENKAAEKEQTDMRTMANDALVSAGLDPKIHYSLMRGLVQDQIEKDKTWFSRTPVDKQFEILAERTREHASKMGWVPKEKVKKANEEHRREADGGIEHASRRATTRQAQQRDEEDDDRPRTMIDAMHANQRALRERARTASSVRGR